MSTCLDVDKLKMLSKIMNIANDVYDNFMIEMEKKYGESFKLENLDEKDYKELTIIMNMLSFASIEMIGASKDLNKE